jgi:hypothetical protein
MDDEDIDMAGCNGGCTECDYCKDVEIYFSGKTLIK